MRFDHWFLTGEERGNLVSDFGAASGFLVLPLFVIWSVITSVFMFRDA